MDRWPRQGQTGRDDPLSEFCPSRPRRPRSLTPVEPQVGPSPPSPVPADPRIRVRVSSLGGRTRAAGSSAGSPARTCASGAFVEAPIGVCGDQIHQRSTLRTRQTSATMTSVAAVSKLVGWATSRRGRERRLRRRAARRARIEQPAVGSRGTKAVGIAVLRRDVVEEAARQSAVQGAHDWLILMNGLAVRAFASV